MLGIALSPTPPVAASPPDRYGIDPGAGIMNIDHLIFVVQENRSFDHYFGTFPGADGLPRARTVTSTVCVPDPRPGAADGRTTTRTCTTRAARTTSARRGSPFTVGAMDGSIRALETIPTSCRFTREDACRRATPGPRGQPDVVGYHTSREIPNYWAYARTYGLQDHMFAPSDSWTLPSHLYLVSAWSATCPRPMDPMSCRSDLPSRGTTLPEPPHWIPADGTPRPYAWADITWLLSNADVSWAYYVGRGTCVLPPCLHASPEHEPDPEPASRVPDREGHQLVREHQAARDVLRGGRSGNLPSVSWVMSSYGNSEHPPDSISNGQAWVTKVVNAVMSGPEEQWLHTAIFITWDDWGGFYDHVPPIQSTRTATGSACRASSSARGSLPD